MPQNGLSAYAAAFTVPANRHSFLGQKKKTLEFVGFGAGRGFLRRLADQRCSRGFITSRSSSPTRLMLVTVISRATPGSTLIQG